MASEFKPGAVSDFIRFTRPFLPIFNPPPKLRNEYDDQFLVESDEPLLTKSVLGTPVLTEIAINGGRYTLRTGDREVERIFDAYTFPEAVVEVQLAKNIVTSKIAGRNGTVKEFIGEDDYQISILTGFYTNTRRYPRDLVELFNKIVHANIALEVSGRALDIHGISRMVITNVSWPDRGNFVNIQPIEITAISDEPVELSFNEQTQQIAQAGGGLLS